MWKGPGENLVPMISYSDKCEPKALLLTFSLVLITLTANSSTNSNKHGTATPWFLASFFEKLLAHDLIMLHIIPREARITCSITWVEKVVPRRFDIHLAHAEMHGGLGA